MFGIRTYKQELQQSQVMQSLWQVSSYSVAEEVKAASSLPSEQTAVSTLITVSDSNNTALFTTNQIIVSTSSGRLKARAKIDSALALSFVTNQMSHSYMPRNSRKD